MLNYFEEVAQTYQPMWVEKSSRKFTEAEIALINECVVTQGNFDRSVLFTLKNGKKTWTPIEKSSVVKYADEMNVGDSLDIRRMILVELDYTGTDPKYKVRKTFKIRYTPAKESASEIVSFDNPFGV